MLLHGRKRTTHATEIDVFVSKAYRSSLEQDSRNLAVR